MSDKTIPSVVGALVVILVIVVLLRVLGVL
jgi:hypothetical protein